MGFGISTPEHVRALRGVADGVDAICAQDATLAGYKKISPDKNGNTGLDVLTGKSRLRNYLGDYHKGEGELAFEEVIDILHKNRTKIGISLSEARVMARLRAEYEKSLETLRPLKAQLAWTDGVIDQIVYRLYG